MKTFKFIASTLLALGCVGAVLTGFADAQIHGNFNRSSGFYTEVTGKVLQRPGGGRLFNVVTDAITSQPLLTSTDIMDLGGGAGAEAKIGWRNRVGGHWEIRTSLGKLENNRNNIVAPSLGGVTSPFFVSPEPGEVVTVDSVNYDYTSEFYSIELMRRCSTEPGFTWFWGPRFISLKEEFNFGTFSDFGLATVTTNNQFTTSNSLIGGQVGLELNLPVGRNFICNGFIRTGAYGNPTVTKTKVTTTGPFGPQGDGPTTKQDKGIGSFVGEVGGTLYYQIVPNVCSSFVGYEATWIDGVALAPTQALSVGETEPVTNNTPFWHSINFGLRFEF